METLLLRLALAVVLVLPTPLVAAAPATTAANRPNVVLIISDDQGWGDFGFMGHPVIRTPRLDGLAARSAVFPNGYVPTSLCRASLASLMTGLYGTQHKICCNDFPMASDRSVTHPFIRSVPTVPRLLADAGYRCLQTGKFWEGHFSNAGFTHGMTEKGRHGDEGLIIGRKTMQPVFDFIDDSSREKKPFFVWYAPMMPHTPHDPPQRFLEHYVGKVDSPNVAAYYAMCEWFDETCGQLLDFLDKRKLTDNTLVVFIVDNGWVQDPAHKGRFDPRSKRSQYDAGLRTPVIVAWPGRVKPGRYNDLVSSLDVSATMLTACGVQPPPTMQGLSLLEAAAGKAPLPRDAVFGEIFTHDAVELDKPVLSMTHRWARVGHLKLVQPRSGNAEPELYDLQADPTEQRNLAADRPEDVQRLRGRIEQWWSQLHPPRAASD
ncbi:MAG TPA: sulfatase [Tepidisphaeraceae bacterium]|nr:sulfatase [Tepidisphaeraceae bacterium]